MQEILAYLRNKHGLWFKLAVLVCSTLFIVWLLPGTNTIGLVIERRRRDTEKDGLLWFCENCNHKLYEEYFTLTDITTQFQGVFEKFYTNKDLRTCKQCGTEMEPPVVIK